MEMEQKEKFEAYFDLFSTVGWKNFIEEIQTNLDVLVEGAVDQCEVSEAWHYRRGEINKLRQFVGFEDFTRRAFEYLENNEEEFEE